MAVIKTIEIIAQSEKGWEDAAQKAVAEAARTISDIKSVYICEMKADVKDGKITEYVADTKISFMVHDKHA